MKICYRGQQVFLKSAESQRKNKTAKRRSKFSQGTRYLPLTFHLFHRGHFLQRFMRVYIGKKNLALNSVVLQKKEECQKYLCFH